MNKDVKLTGTESMDIDGKSLTIEMNGNDFDASANNSRPFNLINGADLTINAGDSEINCGKTGLVNMTEGTLTINGGSFSNEQDSGVDFIAVSGNEEMVVNLNNVSYKAGDVNSSIIGEYAANITVNVNGGNYEAGRGFVLPKGTIKNATISATNPANMNPAVYAVEDGVKVEDCTIKSTCHGVAVSGGKTLTVSNCNVEVPTGKLAFQVFSTGGTIKVNDCTWTGGYGTTGKMKAGCTAIIIIDGVEKYRKG